MTPVGTARTSAAATPAGAATTARPNDACWRTLEERAMDPAFQERLTNEFPSEIEAITDPVARRTFLKLMGASMALAGMTGATMLRYAIGVGVMTEASSCIDMGAGCGPPLSWL